MSASLHVEKFMPTNLTENVLREPVTRHLRRDFACFLPGQTVEEALEQMRRHPPEGRIIYFYVVDQERRLRGVVPTRRLLLSPLDKRIEDIMVRKVIAIPGSATVLEACEFFTLHRLLAFPVVDERGRLVGVIDVELYTQELSTIETNESNENMFQLIGVHLTAAQQSSSLASFRGRFPWLLCNLTGGVLAAFLSGIYQDVLSWNGAALALFVPVVLALAESVSIQSVSLALDVMHGQPPTWGGLLQKLRVESLTGLFLGGASAFLVGLVALLWRGESVVALCLVLSIAVGGTAAATIGMALPYLLRLLKRNPQLAAGPIALALADMITLLIYFNLARVLLSR
jgi:magnesium transporter